MENEAAKLYCPNEYCQSPNPLTHKFCQQCSTPLPHNYLWTVGESKSLSIPGEIVAERYLVIDQSVVLDLQPGLLPQIPELDKLDQIKAYLKLVPYRLHIPQVYGIISLSQGQSQTEILLLEKPPLVLNDGKYTSICSQLVTAWNDASSIRQMNWLWQIAHLWQPLIMEGVASSLLDVNLVRVEGGLVHLLELRFDSQSEPQLSELGKFWQPLINNAQPAIADFLKQVVDALIQGQIHSSEQLITVLDQGLIDLGKATSGEHEPSETTTIKIITKTDTGPSRQHNEDACYPESGKMITKPPKNNALAIVCDGIGGHEGGEVASNLAIETIKEKVKELTKVPYDRIDPLTLLTDLEQAVAIVNDKISQRNDTEHRQGRQRMGTTLVMALPLAHEIYITHIGDSRAYWITRHSCNQITLDDDVASREVRLGYAVYREALQHSGSGSLVQALGMSQSSSLHPTAQRFIVDEDAVFLLTSDGLSDFDRIEECWETEILPIITGETTIENVADRLIEIANTKNGHDNVTIALLHYQIQYSEPDVKLQADIPDISTSKTLDLSAGTNSETNLNHSSKTQVIPEPTQNPLTKLSVQVAIILIIILGAVGLAYFYKLQQEQPSPLNSPSPTTPPETISPTPAVTESPTTPTATPNPNAAPNNEANTADPVTEETPSSSTTDP